jgi:hypothetical protein
MTKHIHAESMALYAQDALTADKPWKLWEFKDIQDSSWNDMIDHPTWCIDALYRRKPKTININGFEVPQPVREPFLNNWEIYYVTDISNVKDGYLNSRWTNDLSDHSRLKAGLIHLTKEAAALHSKALLSFTETK